jgi:Peptidase A4 family
MSLRAIAVAVAAAAAALAGAPAALADSAQSSNWAGYAVHRSGVTFTRVIGAWTQPDATCTAGEPTYSAVWVGIGGYSESSQALEQIGTEADCSATGKAVSSAWYELVPAASRTIKLTIDAGDHVRASVSVVGRRVALTLDDLTRHRSFARTLQASALDTASAEWIVEAPSVCGVAAASFCRTLPLADFGSTGFTAARATAAAGQTGSIADRATSAAGQTGSIADRRWTTTRISLSEGGRRFIDIGGPTGRAAAVVTAVPSALTAAGSAFTVTYQGTTTGVTPAPSTPVSAGRLVHTASFSPTS